jgi:hypothetical protein
MSIIFCGPPPPALTYNVFFTFALTFGNLGGGILYSWHYSHEALFTENNIHNNTIIENTGAIHNILTINTDTIQYSY